MKSRKINTSTKEKISISIDRNLFRSIEKDRGLIKRSSYIEDMLWRKKKKRK